MIAPLVSVIIPVGPAHAQHAAVAVASCQWQTFGRWEAIVVNDTGAALALTADVRVRVLPSDAQGDAKPVRRAARARNIGIQAARGTFVVCLDADDYLLPSALEHLLRGHAAHEQAYTYSAHYSVNDDGNWGMSRPRYDYDQQIYTRFNLHPITALIPTSCARDVGGFDEDAPGWEDWTFYLRLARAGYCGGFTNQPTFVYRHSLGVNHHLDAPGGERLMEAVRARYRNDEGEITFMACGCSGGAAQAKLATRVVVAAMGAPDMGDSNVILLEYIGPGEGKQTFRAPSGREYRAGRHPANRYLSTANGLDPSDVDHLVGLGLFARVPPPAPFVEPPKVELPKEPRVIAEGGVSDDDALDMDGEVARPSKAKKERARG